MSVYAIKLFNAVIYIWCDSLST